MELLEIQQSTEMPTRYRFSLKEDSLIAEVEQREPTAVGDKGESGGAHGWRTVVEMVS